MKKIKTLLIISFMSLMVLCGSFTTILSVRAVCSDITYVLNTNTKKFHLPDCKSVSSIKSKNRKDTAMSYDEVIDAGYVPCQNCHPDLAAPRTAGDGKAASASISGSSKKNVTAATNNKQAGITYVLNTNTKKFHRPGCSSVSTIKDKNRKDTTLSYDDVVASGYSPCGKCHPY